VATCPDVDDDGYDDDDDGHFAQLPQYPAFFIFDRFGL
jgi:hypothetical protein